MAGLFLVRDDAPDATLAGARVQFARHGFGAPTALALPGWRALHWPSIAGGPDTLLVDGEDFVAIAGTLSVDGLIGAPALAKLLEMSDVLPAIDWSRIGGQFVALVRRRGRAFLFTDWFAAFQLFRDVDATLFSTSLLAALGALPRVSFDAQGVYEWAFNVVPIGDATVFEQLSTLGPRQLVELTPDGHRLHALNKPLATARAATLPEHIERQLAALSRVVGTHVAAFGDRVNCPLSGGLDSRLLLASLRAAGSTPHVYVYGPPGSEDVRVARAIGTAQGFAVEWIDKEAAPLAPDAFADQVAANFEAFDGLPTFGNIFDNGGHLAAQHQRHADGRLAASGGCGEVFRDFFYLPDRPISTTTVARSFFARFVASDATDLFDGRDFLDRIAAKLADAIGADPDDRLERQAIEQLYPRVRCRALFGREISLEARHGAYLMPFLDQQVVAEAMTLPMPLKQAGRFEAMLIDAIDPALAREPSAYGHHFAEPPSLAHRRGEWLSRIRPAWLRQRSYSVQRRLGRMGDEHGGLLGPDYMSRVIDPAFPAMRRFFRMEAITDSGLWRRIACLEYLAARLGSKLA